MACEVSTSPRSNTRSPKARTPRLQRATARRWSPHPICSSRCRQTRRWYQMEGALECVFKGMRKLSIGCVITSGKPRPGHRLPLVGPEPSCRTRQEEHALSIVRDQFQSAIPQRVARQHCPRPLHRHGQHKAIAQSEGRIYHRTVNRVLTGCLTGRAHPSMLLHAFVPASRANVFFDAVIAISII